MNPTIPLTKIGFFNPGRLTDEEIEQSFIARIPFFEFILKKIVSEKPDSIPQHYLIIGQRGMGKTSLLIRIAAELRKVPYRDSFIPLSFPEEQYNIDRLSKFWLNCLDALADALDKEHQASQLKELDKEISSLSKEKALNADIVYSTFKKWSGKTGRRPVLLVDNLNLIFSKLSKEEQHQLRGILISEGSPILVGASAVSIEETVDYGAPFYDAFQISYLKKLNFQESLDVLLNLAKITGTTNFSDHLFSKRGRVEALYDLTGGTPRTLAILFPLIQKGFSEAIQTDLDALLDAITPLYKARFEELAPQLQVVLDATALHWDPVNLEQLREITLLENQQLSPQLKRLVDVGWLQKMNAYEAKGAAYELSERFFNIWYLMRRSSRRQKRELYYLTKFLESLYGEDLDKIAKERLCCKVETINGIALDLALADATKESDVREKLRTRGYDTILSSTLKNQNLAEVFPLPDDYRNRRVFDLFSKAQDECNKKNFEDAIAFLLTITKIDTDNGDAWYKLGEVYEDLKKYSDAEQAYKTVLEIEGDGADAWHRLGHVYQELKQYSQSEDSYKKAISLNSTYKTCCNGLARLYQDTERYKEAEQIFNKLIEAKPENKSFWLGIGVFYMKLGRYAESETAFKKLLELEPDNANNWFNSGLLYQKMNLPIEAEKSFQKSITINPEFASAWHRLGHVYQDSNRQSEAEVAYKKAIQLDSEFACCCNGLNKLYEDSGRYKDSEQEYKRAIKLGENQVSPLNGLGNLYQDLLHKYLQAEDIYLQAMDLEPNNDISKLNLVFLWRDKLNKLKEAKTLFATISKSVALKDSYLLNVALFAYYDKNIGIAEETLKEALLSIGDGLPFNTADDWYRSAAVIIKLGYANSLLKVFSANEYDIIFRPFYVAIEAAAKKDKLYFNSIAAEVREPAKKILERIQAYMK